MSFRTNKEVKAVCIQKLHELIKNIKEDKTSNNYVFRWEVLESVSLSETTADRVRFSVTRTEYHSK